MNDDRPFGVLGVVSVLLSIIFLIGAGILGFGIMGMRSSNAALSEDLVEQRETLALMKDSEITVEYFEQMVYSAKDAGNYVAESINRSHDIIYDRTGAEDMDTLYEKVRERLSGVSAYFPSKFDNGSTWFSCYDSEKKDKSRWQFMTTYSFSGHKIDCVWLCRRQSDDQILAYVTAAYDADGKAFSHPVQHVTVYGKTWQSEISDSKYGKQEGGDANA